MDEMKWRASIRGEVKGIVPILMEDLLDMNLDEFLDSLAEKLTGSSLLLDTRYEIVGHLENTLLLEVRGDPSEILKMEDEEEA